LTLSLNGGLRGLVPSFTGYPTRFRSRNADPPSHPERRLCPCIYVLFESSKSLPPALVIPLPQSPIPAKTALVLLAKSLVVYPSQVSLTSTFAGVYIPAAASFSFHPPFSSPLRFPVGLARKPQPRLHPKAKCFLWACYLLHSKQVRAEDVAPEFSRMAASSCGLDSCCDSSPRRPYSLACIPAIGPVRLSRSSPTQLPLPVKSGRNRFRPRNFLRLITENFGLCLAPPNLPVGGAATFSERARLSVRIISGACLISHFLY